VVLYSCNKAEFRYALPLLHNFVDADAILIKLKHCKRRMH